MPLNFRKTRRAPGLSFSQVEGDSGEPGAPSRPKQPARSYMLWLLSRRDYSQQELRTRLRQKGYEEPDIEAALLLCQSYGYQSDERFAESRARNDSRRMGDRNVRARLAQKGIGADLAEAQLEALSPELDRAMGMLDRFRNIPLDDNIRAKVWRYLSYRGFSSTTVRQALAHLAEQTIDRSDSD